MCMIFFLKRDTKGLNNATKPFFSISVSFFFFSILYEIPKKLFVAPFHTSVECSKKTCA